MGKRLAEVIHIGVAYSSRVMMETIVEPKRATAILREIRVCRLHGQHEYAIPVHDSPGNANTLLLVLWLPMLSAVNERQGVYKRYHYQRNTAFIGLLENLVPFQLFCSDIQHDLERIHENKKNIV